MNFVIHTHFTNGRKTSVPLNETVQTDNLTYSLHRDGDVYTLQMQANCADAVHAIELEMQTPPDLFGDDLYILDNANQTNDIIHIRQYAQFPYIESKDVTVMKNKSSGRVFNAGFVTAWRFYAWVTIDHGKVRLHYEMEDKPLVPGQTYVFEKFMADDTSDAVDFLESYADTVAKLNHVQLHQQTPVGFCSWSCLYAGVNEDNIQNASDMLVQYAKDKNPNLVQIDDRWQENGSFCGIWKEDKEKFPAGIAKTAEHVNQNHMQFGLWAAPLIVTEASGYYNTLKPLLKEDCSLGGAHPFDFSKPEVYDILRENFTRLKDEYKATYFKLDFLACAVHKFTDNTFVRYDGDYTVAYYRKAIKTIRQTVGKDTHLLACGAPILESAGLVDSIRTSCDIIWGKSPSYPTYWQIIKDVTQSILHRFFYHQKIFYNDPDGLVVRDYDNGDGFDSTYGEAQLWATTVAMSGGAVLINDELEKIGPARRELFRQLCPPLGIAAKPLDYFEYPQPTCAYIDVDEDTKFVALYRWDDDCVGVMQMPTSAFGFDKALVINCWQKTVLGVTDTIKSGIMSAHSAEMFLLRRIPKQPAFAYAHVNVFCGVNVYQSSFRNNRLEIKSDTEYPNDELYAFYPDGFTPEGEVVKEVEGGKIVRI